MIDRQPEEDGGGGRGDGHPFFASNSAGIVSVTNNRTYSHGWPDPIRVHMKVNIFIL